MQKNKQNGVTFSEKGAEKQKNHENKYKK